MESKIYKTFIGEKHSQQLLNCLRVVAMAFNDNFHGTFYLRCITVSQAKASVFIASVTERNERTIFAIFLIFIVFIQLIKIGVEFYRSDITRPFYQPVLQPI